MSALPVALLGLYYVMLMPGKFSHLYDRNIFLLLLSKVRKLFDRILSRVKKACVWRLLARTERGLLLVKHAVVHI